MELKDKLAIKVRSLRKQHDMTQKELAVKIGRSHDVVSSIERGQTVPTLDILEAVSEAFDITLSDLFLDIGPGKTDKKKYELVLDIWFELAKLSQARLMKVRDIMKIVTQK